MGALHTTSSDCIAVGPNRRGPTVRCESVAPDLAGGLTPTLGLESVAIPPVDNPTTATIERRFFACSGQQ